MSYFLKLLAFTLVIIICYNLLKIFVLSKYKPNKWIIFAIALAILTGTNTVKLGYDTLPGLAVSGVFAILVLWFVDLFKDDRYDMQNMKKGKKDVKIKPKAKPNRVKNNNDK